MKKLVPLLMTLAVTVGWFVQTQRKATTPAAQVPSPPVTTRTAAAAVGSSFTSDRTSTTAAALTLSLRLATGTATSASSPAIPDETGPLPYLPDGCPPGITNLNQWTRIDPTALSENQLFSLNYSKCTWLVTGGDFGPVATPHQKLRPDVPTVIHSPADLGEPRRILRRPPGYLVGFNRGEWGGALLWYTPTGRLKGKLSDENVVELLPGEHSTIVLLGLAHLGGDYGSAVEIIETADEFKATRSVEFGSAPRAAVRTTPTTVLVVTHNGLVELNTDFSVTNLLVSKWGSLYPTSVTVAQDGTIYVGMRGVVAEVKRVENGYVEEWLLPST